MGRARNSPTIASRSRHASETRCFEKLFPQMVSMTLPTLAVETPETTISAMVVTSAASLRL